MISKKTRINLQKELEQKCKQAKIPGMALVANQNGERIFEKYFGHRDVDQKLPVTDDTIFGVASITKSFASLAIMQLEDAGKLATTDSVTNWIPEFQLPTQGKSDEVTIHHLMTQTTGLPGLSAVHQARAESIANDPDGDYLFEEIPPSTGDKVSTVMDMIKAIKQATVSVIGKPGEVFSYSNESYAILQEIIERASGEDFLDYMDRHVLSPLGMTRSTFLTEDLAEMDNVTELYAYSKDKERIFFHSPAWWNVGEIYTNGSLKASVADMMKYLEVYRQKGSVNNRKILSPSSVEQMTSPHILTPNDIQYGYGFIVGKELGLDVFGHGGGIKGVSSFILVVPEKDLTICVLINIAEAAAEDMAMSAMKHLLNLQEKEIPVNDYKLLAKDLTKYTGQYKSAEGQEVHVSESNGGLTMQIDHNIIRLTPVEKHKFLTPDGKKVAFIERDHNIIAIFRGLRYIEKS